MKNKKIIIFLSIIAIFLLIAIFNYKQADGNLHVYFLNVGQGDAIYLSGPSGEDILIDGGPDKSVVFELGKVMKFYDRDLDLLILTHPDSDHLNGLIDVIKKYRVKMIVYSGEVDDSLEYKAWQEEINEYKIPIMPVKKGSKILIDNQIKLEVLYPFNYLINQEGSGNNNKNSLIMKLSYKDIDFLLPGDAEEVVENNLLKSQVNLESEFFKLPHHGSRNGLGNKKEILKIINPHLAIISVGKNRYGHPHSEIINLLKENKIDYLRTDEKGTIEVITNGKDYQIKTERL